MKSRIDLPGGKQIPAARFPPAFPPAICAECGSRFFSFPDEFQSSRCFEVLQASGGKVATRHGMGKRAVCAPAILRRERRWVRSVFGGEFNAVLVASFNSQE